MKRSEEKWYCFRVWFSNGMATLVDATSEEAARALVEERILKGQYVNKIAKVENLTKGASREEQA